MRALFGAWLTLRAILKFSGLGFLRNPRKSSTVKNLTVALYADKVECTL